jgi:hypothetical protein
LHGIHCFAPISTKRGRDFEAEGVFTPFPSEVTGGIAIAIAINTKNPTVITFLLKLFNILSSPFLVLSIIKIIVIFLHYSFFPMP